MRNAKTTVKEAAVKQLIDKLEKKHTSLRKAAKALGTSHTRLMNWRDGQQRDFLEFLELIRKDLDIPDMEFWKSVMGKSNARKKNL